MAAASRKSHADEPVQLRNTALGDALQTRDIAAIAFALRHGPTVALLPGAEDDPHGDERVWTFRNPATGETALLLFSDVNNAPTTPPRAASLRAPAWLHAYLTEHREAIDLVVFDAAGPHPMQASPEEILRALEA
jgi:hypothetical protein